MSLWPLLLVPFEGFPTIKTLGSAHDMSIVLVRMAEVSIGYPSPFGRGWRTMSMLPNHVTTAAQAHPKALEYWRTWRTEKKKTHTCAHIAQRRRNSPQFALV